MWAGCGTDITLQITYKQVVGQIYTSNFGKNIFSVEGYLNYQKIL